ncbi:hypothetical protein [Pelotomaculum propionicicum]|uniref:hypothetical protein n=1 Tax=Pelotomaculum propionicicum TaxID=258475 RepID=UPI003BA1794D
MANVFRPDRTFDSDTLWHIRAGESFLASGTIPVTDPFSWTAAGAPWISHEWLFEYLIALAYKIGPLGISLLSAIFIIIGLYFYWKLVNVSSSSSITAAFFYFLTLIMISSAWTARPHITSYAFLAITLYLLLIGRKQPAKLWFLPAVFIIWTNSHASVILGLGIVGLEMLLSYLPVFETGNIKNTPGNKKHLTGVFFASITASLINPHGFNLWLFSFKLATDPAYKNIYEWQAPETIAYKSMIFLVITLLIVLLAVRKNKADLCLLIVALLSFFGTLTSVRHFYYFVMVWMIVMVQLVGNLELSKKTISLFGGALALIFIINFSHTGWVSRDTRALAEKAGWPVKAVDWLEENKAERIFNRYNWGGYLIFRGIPVFIDGRADLYHMAGMENDPFLDYVDLMNYKQPPEEILQKYDVRYFLFPSGSWQISYLKKCGWKEVYSDEKASVLARDDYMTIGEKNDKDKA